MPDRYTTGFAACGDGPNSSKTHAKVPTSTSRRAQNGACPGYRAILPGECALGALEGLFWFPGRFMCIGGEAPLSVCPLRFERTEF